MAKAKAEKKEPSESQTLGEGVAAIKAALTKQREVPDIAPIKVSALGRPTKFTPTILTKTYAYINSCEDIFYNYQKGFGSTDTFERKVVPKLPTRDGLALYLNVHRDTVHEWSTKHNNFSDALDLLDAKQKEMLFLGGLSGDYNPTIAKLGLSANHGMKERVDQTTDDKPLPPNVTVNNINTLSNEELIKLAEGSAS